MTTPQTLLNEENRGDNLSTKKEKSAPVRLSLTDFKIKILEVPKVGQTMVLDAIVPSFGVRISAGGAKTFIVQGRVRGEQHPTRYKVGRVGVITLAAARDRAREILDQFERGIHPARERELETQARQRRDRQQREREALEQEARRTANTFSPNRKDHKLRASTRNNIRRALSSVLL